MFVFPSVQHVGGSGVCVGVGCAIRPVLGRILRLDHRACSFGGDLQMVRAALGGGPSSQEGMKQGCQQVSGMQGLILTVLINAISWFSGVGPRCGA